MVTHACNTNTQEVKAGGLGVQGHLWLHSMFKASLAYTKPCLNKEKRKGEEEGWSGGGKEKRSDRNGKKKGEAKREQSGERSVLDLVSGTYDLWPLPHLSPGPCSHFQLSQLLTLALRQTLVSSVLSTESLADLQHKANPLVQWQ